VRTEFFENAVRFDPSLLSARSTLYGRGSFQSLSAMSLGWVFDVSSAGVPDALNVMTRPPMFSYSNFAEVRPETFSVVFAPGVREMPETRSQLRDVPREA
jgi:hypothetical protein